MRRNLWISAVLLAAVGTPAVHGADTASPTPVATNNAAPLPSTERYRAALLHPDTKPGPRDEAARRLAASTTPADVAAIRDALLLNAIPSAQVAAARAISTTDTRDPSWVAPLTGLLGANRATSDAAIAALANYSGTSAGDPALDGLQQFANGPAPVVARAPALRAMGRFLSKRVADALVTAVSSTNATIQAAAADALTELTGETDHGTSPAQWQAWRAAHQNDSPLAFKSYLADVRTASAGPARIRQDQLNGESQSFMETGYLAQSPANRARTLTSYLDARSGPIRALGAKLALGEVGNRQILDPALPRLRDLIADEDAEVRLLAVKAVKAAVDPLAVPMLVAQLGRERSPDVQKQLMQAIGKLQVLDAAPALVSLLADNRPDVAAAAARTLGDGETENSGLGHLLRAQRPAVAARACAELRKALASRTAPAFDAFRAECVKALAVLGDPQAFSTFRNLLAAQPPEPWIVRAAALSGFGTLGDTRADEIVSGHLGDNDKRVGLAAAKAMRTVGTLGNMQQLYNESGPQETDSSVREAAWLAMAHLLENGSVDLLSKWVTQFPNDPDHRLFVQQEFGRALQKAGQADGVAANNQVIATTLADDLNRPEEAIGPLMAAFDYYHAQPAGGADKLENLVGQILATLLKARQWTPAADFAGKEIREFQKYQPIAGTAFEDAAERLKKDHDIDGLNALIAAASSIKDPPLETRFVDFLKDIRKETSPPPPPRP